MTLEDEARAPRAADPTPSRVCVVVLRMRKRSGLQCLLLETPGGRWELPSAPCDAAQRVPDAARAAIAAETGLHPESLGFPGDLHVDLRAADARSCVRYVAAFQRADVLAPVVSASFAKAAWVTVGEVLARLDPEHRAPLEQMLQESRHLRLCCAWYRATARASARPREGAAASHDELRAMEAALRAYFTRVFGAAAVESRFAVPENYLRLLALAGGTWRWGGEYGFYLHDASVVVANTTYLGSIYENCLPDKAALWVMIGSRSDRHDHHLCCDRAHRRYGTVADFNDDHPWNNGGGDGESPWGYASARPDVVAYIADVASSQWEGGGS